MGGEAGSTGSGPIKAGSTPPDVAVVGVGLGAIVRALRIAGLRVAPEAGSIPVEVGVVVLGAPADLPQRAAFARLRASSPFAEVVVLASDAGLAVRCEWLERGASAVIEAPWVPREVVAWVRSRSARQRLLRRLVRGAQV